MSHGPQPIDEQGAKAGAACRPAARSRRLAGAPGLLIPLLLAACAFALAFLGPVRSHERSDPWGALLTAQAIVRQGTASLDAYPEVASQLWYRAAPRDGHIYYAYPVGVPLLAAPFVWAANLAGLDMARDEDERALQNALSALTCGLAVALGYALCRRFVSPWAAGALSASFVFATAVGYTLGSALWSINGSLLLSLGALLLFPRSAEEDDARRGAAVGALLGLAYLCRPTAALPAATLFVCAALVRRRTALGMALGGAAAGLLFLACALLLYGSPLPPYYASGWFDQDDPLLILAALAGHLVSPSRGVLVWSPQLLLLLAGAAALAPRLRREPLFWLAIAWAGLHLLVIARFRDWPGGLSYGNRLFTDALPATLLLGALVWRAARERLRRGLRRAVAGAYLALSLVGALIYSGQGPFNPRTLDWGFIGETTISDFPAVMFDWRFPQFLATQAQLDARHEAYYRDPVAPNQIWGRPIWPTARFPGTPAWSPQDVGLSPGLGALFDLGWYGYEPQWEGRWMRATGRLWVASPRATAATLRLTPAALNENGRYGERGSLAVFLDGALVAERPIAVNEPIELELQLPAGISELRLDAGGGEALLGADNGDPRLFAVAVRGLTLTGRPKSIGRTIYHQGHKGHQDWRTVRHPTL